MHIRLYSKDEIAKLIKRAGLRIIYIKTLTHYCIPHLFLHGMKRLLDTGILPRAINSAADKFKYKENKRLWFNPVTLGYTLFNFTNKFNEDISDDKSLVAIGIKAIKQV